VKRPQRPAQRLRQTIDRMPLETRDAMLRAIDLNPIIVGAYTNREGGVCPMLAAHRNGGRTDFAAFAVAWDRYTRAGKQARRATERELRTLRTMLEVSIASESERGGGELARAIDAHLASRASARRDTGERDRTKELAGRSGWAWLRPFRRLDEYERAISQLEATEVSQEAAEAWQEATEAWQEATDASHDQAEAPREHPEASRRVALATASRPPE
jgi:hypothetical protein